MNTTGQQALIGRGWAFPPQIGPHGSLALTSPETEIAQAIAIILTTAPGERVMRPNFGCRLNELLFASMNTETLALARRYVEEALTMWEPRINLVNLSITTSDAMYEGCLLIEMEYEIKTTRDRRTLVYPFYLIPED